MMRRLLFTIFSVLLVATTWGQTTILDILKAKKEIHLGTPYVKVTSIGQDTLLAGASNLQLATTLVVKAYASKLGGRPVSTAAPTSGDVITWDGTKWAPAAPTGGGVAQPTGQMVYGSGSGITSDTFFTYANQRITLDIKDPDLVGGQSYGLDFYTQAATNGENNNILRAIAPDGTLKLYENAGNFTLSTSSTRLSIGASRLSISLTDSLWMPGYSTAVPDFSASEKTLLAMSSTGRFVRVEGISGTQINQMGASSGQALAWNGTTWAPATISGGGSSPTYETFMDFTGTTLTPTNPIPSSERDWRIDLYRTGVRMQYLQDYTISGSDIVLTLAATTEDFVLIIH